MKTIEERAKSMADWILRRAPQLKAYNLPKMFADMLTEQKAIDIDKACGVIWDIVSPYVYTADECEDIQMRLRKAMEK